MQKKYSILNREITIASCKIKNRYAMAPMGTFGMVDENGVMNEDCIEYYIRRAQGGVGLIITGMCIIEDRFEKNVPDGVPLFSASVDHELLRNRMQKLTKRVHDYSCKIFLQMSAGFGRVAHLGSFCKGAIAPSVVTNRFNADITHRELSADEIQCYISSFSREADFAKSVGFDGVEIHALHEGYLLDQFGMEIFNKRTDEYGGAFENRYRLSIEILKAIKTACGKGYPVSIRFSPKHYMKAIGEGALPGETFSEAGRDMPEGLSVAAYLEKAGYDALDVDLGCYDSHFWSHPPVFFEDGMYMDAAMQVKKVVSIPVLVSGRTDNPDFAEKAILENKCDIVSVGRPLLADPDLPQKVFTGKVNQIRTCISCNYGCSARIRTEGKIGCSVNAECANELVRRIMPAKLHKTITVVGGGPAGMEFARVCAIRGHEVELLEKTGVLGGQLIPASMPPFKFHDKKLIEWYASELNRLNVKIYLNMDSGVDRINKHNPDCIAVATGAKVRIPDIPGIMNENVFSVTEMLMNIYESGEKVVILGAGQAGVELGVWLANIGKKVVIISKSSNFMKGAYHNSAIMANLLLARDNAKVIYNTQIERIETDGVWVMHTNGLRNKISADTVVYATGFQAENSLYPQLLKQNQEVFLIGDAEKVSNVYYAIHSAYTIASRV